MCGRFTITLTIGLAERFGACPTEAAGPPRYNIAPSQTVPVVVTAPDGSRDLVRMQWGLVPYWAKDPAAAGRPINARAETLGERSSFSHPLAEHRCIVPANGFYEWKRVGKVKEPYYIHRNDDGLFGMAGLYDIWRICPGEDLLTFTIVTTEPNDLVSRYHDRMPAILSRENEDAWLSPGTLGRTDLSEILAPCPPELFEAYRVSRLVNDPEREGSELIRKVPEQSTFF